MFETAEEVAHSEDVAPVPTKREAFRVPLIERLPKYQRPKTKAGRYAEEGAVLSIGFSLAAVASLELGMYSGTTLIAATLANPGMNALMFTASIMLPFVLTPTLLGFAAVTAAIAICAYVMSYR